MQRPAGIGPYLWVAATIVGLALPALIVSIIPGQPIITTREVGEPSPSLTLLTFLLIVLTAAFWGAGLGFAQWLALRRYVATIAWQWIPATAISFALGMPLGIAVGEQIRALLIGPGNEQRSLLEPYTLAASISGALMGFVIGLAQAFILRHYARRVMWWVVANALGWAAMQALIMIALSHHLLAGNRLFQVIGILFGLFALASITGGMLVELLRRQVIYVAGVQEQEAAKV